MTRIAFYAPMKPPTHAVPSGDRRMARLLMDALGRAGHETFLVSRFRSYDGKGDPCRQARLRAVGGKLAERYIRRLAPDPPTAWFTYHVYHKAPDWIGPRVAAHFHIPYLIAEASHAPKRRDGPWAIGYDGAAESIHAADAVLTLNPEDAPCLAPLLRRPDVAVSLKPFLDLSPYHSASHQRTEHRTAQAHPYSRNPDAPQLLTVAMMRDDVKLKSYRVLAKALTRVTDLSWTLFIVGDGPARPLVEDAFGPLGDRVRFLGARDADTLPCLYAAADLFVWPAIGEAYGMVLLEAQATGCPVVAGRTGGVPQIVRDGETGLLATVGDHAAFEQAIRTLLSDHPRREAMRRKALEVTTRDHGLDAAAATLRTTLRRLLPDGRSNS